MNVHEEKKYLEYLGAMLDLVNSQIKHPFDKSEIRPLFNKKRLVLQHLVEVKISLMLKRYC